ncbi:hypothetical protein DL770_006636 [Monosporascus sp. CRB-9-2]|nr:hypothetical protein DL770_006636 [Monosporascus sp. CRB-9-2]
MLRIPLAKRPPEPPSSRDLGTAATTSRLIRPERSQSKPPPSRDQTSTTTATHLIPQISNHQEPPAHIVNVGQPEPSYKYKPLPERGNIRLVRILPDDENIHGLKLELSLASFDDYIPYIALSYTWGCAELNFETGEEAYAQGKFYVECQGASVKITENLFDFLQRANKDPSTKEQYYWIDQICINQADLAERGHQVGMMGAVFKSAREVHVWLGKNNPPPEFIWVCRNVMPAVLRLEQDLVPPGSSLRVNSSYHKVILQALGADIRRKWEESKYPFYRFFWERRWFSRGWVVQENRDTISQAMRLLWKISQVATLSSALPTVQEVTDQGIKISDFSRIFSNHPFTKRDIGVMSDRIPFVTAEYYVGHGPQSLVEGDEVWLLNGGRAPFILRKAEGGRYRLVGEAYLHGAMYGELMAEDVISRIGPVEII